MAYAMFLNLFLLGAEFFRDMYSATQHALFTENVFRGLGSHAALVPYAWLSLFLCAGAFFLFLFPRTRRHPFTLYLGAIMAFFGFYLEKGNVLVIAGFTPSTLGEVYEYSPSRVEVMVAMGVYGVGFLIYTILLKIAVPVLRGRFEGAGVAAPVVEAPPVPPVPPAPPAPPVPPAPAPATPEPDAAPAAETRSAAPPTG
jgi:molybdopterin-containing oxidoreductase family membrane subunit